ncbi:3-hexulose-6-phosphate synthase [[Eubacterium] cellulosolvens]
MPKREPILQVALDVVDLHRALQIAQEAVDGGVDWLEVGTPLIKSEGMNAIRALRKRFPEHTIVADMKTLDVGGFEVEMASKAGANVICVMGMADDQTITEAVLAADKYGSNVMVDLLNVPNKPERAHQVQGFGVKYVCTHVSIDAQMVNKSPLDDVKSISKKVDIPLGVAGGLNSETAPEAVKAGAEIIIIGGAINKAPKVEQATKLIKKAIKTKKSIKSEWYRKHSEDELYDAFMKVSAPNLADAMHKKGAMVGIRPLRDGYKMVGRAVTVRSADGDWAKPVEAIDRAKPGEVIVINADSGHIAVWGELATWSCKVKGIAGVVIDGAVRDTDDIMAMGLPVFSRYIAPNAGEPKGFGEIGAEIICGGICVREGDWIIGDDSGVVVVPKERAVEVANRAIDVHERENRLREEIQRGSTLSKVLELKKWEKLG